MISIIGVAGAVANAAGQVGVNVIADAAMKRLIPEGTKLGLKICADVAAFFLSSAAGAVVSNEVDRYIKKIDEIKDGVAKMINKAREQEQESEEPEPQTGPEVIK